MGDVVLRNAHELFSYHLANVVDDMEMGITHVVRGEDLEEATVAHLYLQAAFEGPVIQYHHLALALDEQGFKLSKQTKAPAVTAEQRAEVLHEVFIHLGLPAVELGEPEEMFAIRFDFLALPLCPNFLVVHLESIGQSVNRLNHLIESSESKSRVMKTMVPVVSTTTLRVTPFWVPQWNKTHAHLDQVPWGK